MRRTELLEKLFSKRVWKRVVKSLICLVVFCTSYALIRPVMTAEAKTWCSKEEHEHTTDCYEKTLDCSLTVHEHSEECFDDQGDLICSLEEHIHKSNCYSSQRICTKEEHQHSLECYSNPEADLESSEIWKKSLPDKEEEWTTRETIVEMALSQERVKESTQNYLVKDETEKVGITRYGQWEADPYEEDWAGAFVRFVLHFCGLDEPIKHADHDLTEWIRDLSEDEKLEVVSESEPGDILFLFTDDSEPKAGIVLKTDDERITAMMGDWNAEVRKETFSRSDDRLHSIFKPVPTERKDEAEDKEASSEVKSEIPSEEPEQPKESEQEKPESTEPSKEESSKSEEPEAEESLPWDYTVDFESSDGTAIEVQFNEGTFENPEDVVFQAMPKELSEEQLSQLQEHLEADQNYEFKTWDISSRIRNEQTELEEIEPLKPVKVTITLPKTEEQTGELVGLFHFRNDGELEDLSKQKAKLASQPEKPQAQPARQKAKAATAQAESETSVSEETENADEAKETEETKDPENEDENLWTTGLIESSNRKIVFVTDSFSDYTMIWDGQID